MALTPFSEVLADIVTSDGYRFHHLKDGRVVDSRDPEAIDMSWDTLAEFAESLTECGYRPWTYHNVR